MKTRHDPSWLKNYDPPLSYAMKVILSRFTKFLPASDLSSHKKLVTHAHAGGKLVWSEIIKAYRTIWEPGDDPILWGLVVCSVDAEPETAYERLPSVLGTIHELLMSDDGQLDDEAREFMGQVRSNEVTASIKPVPASISPDIQCIVLDCLLARNGLPDGYLKHGPLPVLVVQGNQHAYGYAAALHQRHWHEAFLDEWKHGFEESVSGDGSKDLTAVQILGLPPDQIEDLEQAVLSMCDKEKLTATFLHVGFLGKPSGDSEKKMVPTSPQAGDLTFLGPTGETAQVQHHLQLILNAHLSPEQLGHAKIELMPMAEFVEAYGWLVEELSNQA